MKRAACFLALALIASLSAMAPASARKKDRQAATAGGFAVQEGRAHSSQFGTPMDLPMLLQTTPLEFDFEEGDQFRLTRPPLLSSGFPSTTPA